MAEVRVPLDLEDELTTYDSPDTTYTDVGVEDDLVSYKINKANEKIFFQGTLPDLIEANETNIETNTTTISSNSDNISALDSTLSGSVVAVSESTSYEITSDAFRIVLDASTVSASGQIITFTEGSGVERINLIQVYNGSSESIEVTDGTTSFTLTSEQYSKFFFEDSTLNQETTIADISGQAVDTTLVSMTGDTSESIETLEKTVVIEDTVTSSYTLTITSGTDIDVTRYIWVKNNSSEVQYVTDGTNIYWIESGQKVKFYIDDSTLVWGSTSWEEVWFDLTNTEDVGYQDQNIGGLNSEDKLEFLIYYTSGTNYRVCEMIVYDPDVIAHSSQAGASSSTYSVVVADPDEGDNGEFSCPVTGNIRRIRRWHDGE